MRKLELYKSTLERISELQKQLGIQKERFLNGQSDYLIRINDKMLKLRNEADSKKSFMERVSAAFDMIFKTKDKKNSVVVSEMNELLRRTQTYLNIIHEIEMSESKMQTLISQAGLLEEQALAQEKVSFVNTQNYVANMSIEQKMNQLIVADNKSNLANLTPDRQKLFMNSLGYIKDLLKNPDEKFLNDIASDMYECIKDTENIEEVLQDEPIKQISPLVLNSMAMVLMDLNKDVVDMDNEIDSPCCYDELFGATGWSREYAMNEYVDINGIIDQGTPMEQVVITEIANRIESLNVSYDNIIEYYESMDNTQLRDLYLMNEDEYKKKYDMNLDLVKLKKYVTFNEQKFLSNAQNITQAIENAESDEDMSYCM